MSHFHFTKMHALGNNYIYVNQMSEQLPEDMLNQVAIDVSSVRTGIGADGLILICSSELADFKMRIFNADGSEGKNCGNGLRCVARYVYDKQLIRETNFTLETAGGCVEAFLHVENDEVIDISINMGQPGLTRASLPMLGDGSESTENASVVISGEVIPFVGVSMGNPHAVIFVNDVTQAPVTILGPKIETNKLFPERVNVEFIEVIAHNEIDFRVWERGSGVTYACGTGACAAVVAAVLKGKVKRDQEVIVHLLGGDLYIKWLSSGDVWMKGSADYICEGTYF